MSSIAHSPLGASSAHRWIACPGSVRLCASLPPSPDTPYTLEGTAAHAIAAECMENDVWSALSRVGTSVEVKPGVHVEVTAEMAAAVSDYLALNKDLISYGGVALTEHRFALDAVGPDLFGTCDRVVLDRHGVLHVLDYKHGAGVPVEVERNPQLMYYGLGAMFAFGTADVKSVALWIVQPRCASDGVFFTRWDIDPLDLMEWSLELAAAAEATRAPDAPLVPGKHCRFCPAKATCTALRCEAERAAAAEFTTVQLETASAGDVACWLATAEKAERWIKAVRAFAYGEAQRGRLPAGYKLVAKRGRRRWKEGDTATLKALEGAYSFLDDDFLAPRSVISPAALEKRVGKHALARVSHMIASVSGGTNLVPLSAEGEPVAPTGDVANDFEAFDDVAND